MTGHELELLLRHDAREHIHVGDTALQLVVVHFRDVPVPIRTDRILAGRNAANGGDERRDFRPGQQAALAGLRALRELDLERTDRRVYAVVRAPDQETADRVIAGNPVLAEWAAEHNGDVVVIPSCVASRRAASLSFAASALRIFSGVFAATSSMSMPPADDAINTCRTDARSSTMLR